jgi:polysaccharide biosynthesis protein PslJ
VSTPGEGLARTVVPVRVVVGLLALTVLVRYAVLHVGYVPVDELLTSDRIVLAIFSWSGVALLAAEGLQDRTELGRVLRTLVGAVAAMAIVGFLQFRAGIDLTTLPRRIPGLHENVDLVTIQDRSGFRRPSGTATHPIEFGCVIAVVFPLALHAARFDFARSRFRRWLPVAMIAIGIPVAVSRSAILGAAIAGFVVFLGLDPRVRPKALMAVAGFLVVVYATTPGLLGTLRSFFLSTGSDSRINDYGPALAHIRQAPWFGHGPGTFIADSDKNNVLDNQYLLTLIEIGVIGLAVVLVYLLAAAFLGRGARHRSDDPATRDLGQSLAAASVAAAVTAYTFDAFSFRMFSGVMPLCLGMAGGLWAMTRAGERSTEDVPAAEAALAQAAGVDAPATLHVVRAVDLPDDHAEGVAARAVESDPQPGTTIIDLSDGTPTVVQDLDSPEPLRLQSMSAAEPSGGAVDDADGDPELPLEPDRPAVHDLRRIAVLICSVAAVTALLGLPLLIDRSDGGQVAQVGVPTAPGDVPPDMSSTTLLSGEPSSKSARSRTSARGGQSRAVDTTGRRSTTTQSSRSSTTTVSVRPSTGGPTPTGPTATTPPTQATTVPPPPPTDPPPPSTTTTESTTTTTETTTTTTTAAP